MEVTIVEVEFETRLYVKRCTRATGSDVYTVCRDLDARDPERTSDCELNVRDAACERLGRWKALKRMCYGGANTPVQFLCATHRAILFEWKLPPQYMRAVAAHAEMAIDLAHARLVRLSGSHCPVGRKRPLA